MSVKLTACAGLCAARESKFADGALLAITWTLVHTCFDGAPLSSVTTRHGLNVPIVVYGWTALAPGVIRELPSRS